MLHIAIAVIVLFLCFVVWAYRGEKKAYNNGICPRCYGNLYHFNTDSQGGQGYTCKNRCDYYIWVSYPFIVSKHHSI